MNRIEDFIGLFYVGQDSIIEETFLELKIIFKTKDIISSPTSDNIIKHIDFLNERDSLKITVLIGLDDPIDFYSANNPDDFYKALFNRLKIREDNEDIEIQFIITKSKKSGLISIYFPDKLIEYLLTLDLKGVLYVIGNALGKEPALLLESQSEKINFRTESIYFDSNISIQPKTIDLNFKDTRIELANTVSSFNFLNKYKFIPEDFFIESSNSIEYSRLFNRIATIYSIAYLYDIVTIEGNNVEYKLNGYKSITGSVSFDDIPLDQADEYYKIYNWCYTGGNLIDKIGLSRNIISLHLQKPNSIELHGNPFQSIQSSYKVYEKQNIKQYIEIRNNISDQLLGFHERANNIIETFASGFQKSALALISFYISAIVLKLLSSTALINVFTLDATILSMAFLLCSYIYFRVSAWDIKEQKKRFITNYENLKERYLDLLDSADIQRILNNDKEFNSDLNYIDSKYKRYSKIWISYLLILFFSSLILFLYYNLSTLVNSPIWHLFCNRSCK